MNAELGSPRIYLLIQSVRIAKEAFRLDSLTADPCSYWQGTVLFLLLNKHAIFIYVFSIWKIEWKFCIYQCRSYIYKLSLFRGKFSFLDSLNNLKWLQQLLICLSPQFQFFYGYDISFWRERHMLRNLTLSITTDGEGICM